MSRIKIIQYGVCHEHAAGKIATLQKMADVYEIAGVVDDRDTQAPRFAGYDMSPYEGLPLLSRKDAFSIQGLQAVCVEVANDELVPVGKLCAERGLAMHLDKPGGEKLDPYRELLHYCAERNIPLQMGYMFRGNPALQFCLEAIKKQWIGEIFEVQMSMSHNYGGEAYQKYISEFAGGIMYNLGCHSVDFITTMMGRPVNVSPFLHSASGCPDACKNNCAAIIEYPHAIVYLHACSYEVEGNARRLKICGEKGTLEMCPLESFDEKKLLLRMVLKEGNNEYESGIHTLDFGCRHDRYLEQFRELADVINGRKKSRYRYQHDCLVHEISLAASGYIQFESRSHFEQ